MSVCDSGPKPFLKFDIRVDDFIKRYLEIPIFR
jgi:hypothetical protein